MSVGNLIGRGKVGFPNSEILSAVWMADDLGDWQSGGTVYLLAVRTEDGRELKIPHTVRSSDLLAGTYERKT